MYSGSGDSSPVKFTVPFTVPFGSRTMRSSGAVNLIVTVLQVYFKIIHFPRVPPSRIISPFSFNTLQALVTVFLEISHLSAIF